MLAVLAANFPGVKAEQAGAENLPLDDASVDAVLVGQAWHWFDHELALAEARRVVRPGGWLGLIGNTAFPRTDWQLELARLDPDFAGRTFDEEGEEWEPPGLTGCVGRIGRVFVAGGTDRAWSSSTVGHSLGLCVDGRR